MKIICVGRNYAEHIEELKNETPEAPVLFLKPETAVLPEDQSFVIPDFSKKVDFEVEILVQISRSGKNIDRKDAPDFYRKIGLGIDFTARDLQSELKRKALPWEKAKAFDGAAVIGKFIPKSEFKDVNNLNFRLERNGIPVQKGNTLQMIWQIDALIEYISKYFTLKTGDVIFTGTPAGVSSVNKGDSLVGYVENQKMFSVKVR